MEHPAAAVVPLVGCPQTEQWGGQNFKMGPTEKYLAGFFIRGQNQSNKGVVCVRLLSEKVCSTEECRIEV